MHTVLNLIQSADIRTYYWLNQFHGIWFLDRLFTDLEINLLFKSALFIAAYYYFWFREGPDQQERRSTIVAILVGTLASLFIARALATFAPFRVRPMSDPSLGYRPLSVPLVYDFVGWSGFPSDHAAYLTALGFGLIRLSRRLTLPVILFLAGWICLPRLYLGIHFLSDIVVGAAIGAATTWAALHIEALRSRAARPLLAFVKAKPEVFYTLSFLILFELASMFSDFREPVHAVLRVAASLPHHPAFLVESILLASLCGVGFLLWHRPTPHPPEPASQPSEVPAAKARGARASL